MNRPASVPSVVRIGAVWLSRVFHPFIISVPVLFGVQLLSGNPPLASAGWTALSFAFVTLPMLTLLLVRVRAGRYQDMDVSLREDRHRLYAIGAGCFVLLLVLLALLQAPPIVQRGLQAAFLAVVVGALVNRRISKPSLHALTLAGSAILLLFVSPTLGAILSAVAGLVGWSRVHLTRHTWPDVLWGWGVGAGVMGVWLIVSARLYAGT